MFPTTPKMTAAMAASTASQPACTGRGKRAAADFEEDVAEAEQHHDRQKRNRVHAGQGFHLPLRDEEHGDAQDKKADDDAMRGAAPVRFEQKLR